MDDCPNCGRACHVSCGPGDKSHFICWDCHVHWYPPRNSNGVRQVSAWPVGSVVTKANR